MDWTQRGVYGGFPPEGTRAGYTVDWQTPSDDPQIVRPSKHAEKPTGGGRLALLAVPSDEIDWFLAGPKKISNHDVWAALNQTFSDLGLPTPLPGAQEILWGKTPC